MKKLVPCLLLLLLAAGAAWAADVKKVLDRADKLIQEKKYDSAFRYLAEADPNNDDPGIVLKKIDLAMSFNAHSIYHQVFALRDLKKGEKLEDVRHREGIFNIHVFPPNRILDRLIRKYPKDAKLRKALGIYYYQVLRTYGKRWVEEEDEIVRLGEENLQAAREAGESDYRILYIQGYLKLHKEKYGEAASYFRQSLELDPDDALSAYSMAFASWKIGNSTEALVYAKIALEKSQERALTAEAGRLAGAISLEGGMTDMALRFFQLSAQADSRNFNTLDSMLPIFLQKKDLESADTVAEVILSLDPGEPRLLKRISDVYMGYGRKDELLGFFDRMEGRYQDRDEALGNLFFHKARILLSLGENREGRKMTLAAREHLRKVFPPDDPVFPLLEEMLKKAEEPKGPSP